MKNVNQQWWREKVDRGILYIMDNINPGFISVDIGKDRVITFVIKNCSGMGVGFSICSSTDKFDIINGLNMAASRAIVALISRKTSDKVRTNFDEFPGTWTKNQMLNLMGLEFKYKSVFIDEKPLSKTSVSHDNFVSEDYEFHYDPPVIYGKPWATADDKE